MIGAILYSGQYSGTAQYAKWISESTGLPMIDLHTENPDPSKYDFLILGSSIIMGKLTIHKWVKANWSKFKNTPVILFSVSSAGPESPDMQSWIENSLPPEMIDQMRYVALLGRLDVSEVGWWTKIVLKLGALGEKDPVAKNECCRDLTT